jgi:tRNA(Ile)-lysidine synthase
MNHSPHQPTIAVNWPPAGRYLLAVSGGADSMVLLDLMANAAAERRYELTVAHFDHGLRPGSRADRQFVQGAAKRYDLPIEYHEANLGRASEAAARTARHGWLASRAKHHHAQVVTAHHQDDLIETSLLNLARGSGRRGLAPMQSGPVLRPLLGATRAQLRDYAAARALPWREDPTNADTTNPRNYLRHRLLAGASPHWRQHYLGQIYELAKLNQQIDQTLAPQLAQHRTEQSSYAFPKALIRDLSLPELEELIVAAARSLRPNLEPKQRTVQELALFAKTGAPHTHRPLRDGIQLKVDADRVFLVVS